MHAPLINRVVLLLHSCMHAPLIIRVVLLLHTCMHIPLFNCVVLLLCLPHLGLIVVVAGARRSDGDYSAPQGAMGPYLLHWVPWPSAVHSS